MKLRHGVAVVGILFGVGLVALDAMNPPLNQPVPLTTAGLATAAAFGLSAVVK